MRKLIIDNYLRIKTDKLYGVFPHQSLESSRCRDIICQFRSVLCDSTLNIHNLFLFKY